MYDDLREASCSYINSMPVFGTAIGGSLGATRKDMHAIVAFTRRYGVLQVVHILPYLLQS